MTPPQPVQPQVGPGQGGPLASRGLSSSSKGILASLDWLLLSCSGSSSVGTPPRALLAPCTTKPPTDFHFTCVCMPVERHRLPPVPREAPERFAEGRPSPLGKQGPEGRHQILPPLVHAPPPEGLLISRGVPGYPKASMTQRCDDVRPRDRGPGCRRD